MNSQNLKIGQGIKKKMNEEFIWWFIDGEENGPTYRDAARRGQ